MTLQKKILKVLLWSLGVAAFTGAGSVLLGGDEIAMRVMATALITAAAAAFMLPQARLLDREVTRASALLGVSLVIVIYLLALIGVWELTDAFEEQIWMSTLALIIPGASAMTCLRLRHEPSRRLAMRVGLVCSVVSLVMFMIAVWAQKLYKYGEDGWGLAFCFSIFAAMAVVCLLGAGTDKRYWRWLGVMGAAVAFGIVAHEIVTHSDDGKDPAIISTSLALIVAHAMLVLNAPLKDGQRWLATVAIATFVVTAVLFDVILIYEKDDDDLLMRLTGAASIIAACASLAIGVVARLNRGVDVVPGEPGALEMLDINLVCPRCRKRQKLPLGDSRCRYCDLRIHVRVEEPRCTQCGYLLYKLTSDACPECGAAIQG